jgi:fermentation-respiration switch protein FrsA (DUF1100 family)
VLADLPLPALLVHGSADAQVPVRNAELLHAARPGRAAAAGAGDGPPAGVAGNADAGPPQDRRGGGRLVQQLERSTAA